MLISKSDFINLCKSMGKDPEFEKLRAEVLSILKKQAKSEGNEKDIHKSLLEMDKSFKYFDKDDFIIKSGYPVGTVREWKGRKYIKVAPNKWKPKYDSESKGAKNSITRLMKQVENCKNVEELMNLVMENKQRFTDANGNHLPIVDKLRAAADKKNDALSSGSDNNVGSKKESPKTGEKKYSYDGEKDRDNIISKLKNNELVHPMTGKTMDVTDAVLYDEVKDLSEEERNKKLDKVISDAELNFKKDEKKYKEKKESYEYMRNSKTYSNSDSETRARSAMVTAHTNMANDLSDIVIAKKIKSELKESEAEKHKNRSDAMKGNKNAYKGGPDEVSKYINGKTNDFKKRDSMLADAIRKRYGIDENGKKDSFELMGDLYSKVKTSKPHTDGWYDALNKYDEAAKIYHSVNGGKDIDYYNSEIEKERMKPNYNKDVVEEPKKKSSKNSKPVASAYAPSESTDLDSKTVIASNKSIGEGEVEMPYSKELDAEIKSLNSNRSTDETRYFMNHVYYDDGNLIATDGRRIKTIKVGELDGIPNGSYVDVASSKDGVKIKAKEVTNDAGEKAKFPGYKQVIPSENTQKVSLDNNVLKDKLKTMLKDGSINKKDGRVALEFRDDGVFVDGTKVGNASNIKLKSGGWSNSGIDTNNIFVNANYLLDALTGNESTMMLSDNAGKAMSIGTGSTNNIIMPMNPVNDTDPNKLPDYEAGRKAKNEENESKAQRKAKNKKEIENYMNSFNQTQEQIDKIKENIKTADETVIKNAIEAYTKAEKKFNNPSAAFSSDAPQLNSYGYRLLDMANKDPEFAPLLKEAAKKYGIEVRKSLFDDLDFEYDEEEIIEKSVDGSMDLFESVNIAETVRSVLSEII